MTYEVIPLSPFSGLIGWVPNCDTFHSLIATYRKGRHIQPKAEEALLDSESPSSGFIGLPLLQKLDIFEETLRATQGRDLAESLWPLARLDECRALARASHKLCPIGLCHEHGWVHPWAW